LCTSFGDKEVVGVFVPAFSCAASMESVTPNPYGTMKSAARIVNYIKALWGGINRAW
jgi:hypothetical protein